MDQDKTPKDKPWTDTIKGGASTASDPPSPPPPDEESKTGYKVEIPAEKPDAGKK